VDGVDLVDVVDGVGLKSERAWAVGWRAFKFEDEDDDELAAQR